MDIEKAHRKITNGKGGFVMFLNHKKLSKKYQVEVYSVKNKGIVHYKKEARPEEMVGTYDQDVSLKDLKEDFLYIWQKFSKHKEGEDDRNRIC